MAETIYKYTILTDIPAQKVEPRALRVDIEKSEIVTALDDVNVVGPEVWVIFKDALSVGDKTLLDNDTSGPAGGIIGAHTGEAITPLTAPKMDDGKPFFAPNRFSKGIWTNRAGCSDDVDNGVRYGGSDFTINEINAEVGNYTFEARFIEPIELAGGQYYCWAGGDIGSHLTMEVYAPATVGTSNTGAGAFNKVEVVPSSGMHIYVPAPGVDGDWDIDLDEKLNTNVSFTKAVPVPNAFRTGYFDYDPVNNILSVNASGKGKFDLYDFQTGLGKFMVKSHVPPDTLMDCVDTTVTPFQLLPHWVVLATYYNATQQDIGITFKLYVGRYDIR